jgi:hypothetical protein
MKKRKSTRKEGQPWRLCLEKYRSLLGYLRFSHWLERTIALGAITVSFLCMYVDACERRFIMINKPVRSN